MQTLNIYPADTVKFCLGLFCSGNFVFGEKQRNEIAQIGEFQWENVDKINIKENLMVHLRSGKVVTVMLSDLEFMKRSACNFCADFSAEYADISFGGIGAEEGWTTVIVRSPVGLEIFSDAKFKAIEENKQTCHPLLPAQALNKVRLWSGRKKDAAFKSRKTLSLNSSDLKLTDCPQ
jgi:coenzyme F420 hydrogenase subunit beta